VATIPSLDPASEDGRSKPKPWRRYVAPLGALLGVMILLTGGLTSGRLGAFAAAMIFSGLMLLTRLER
jgi:hypothetical protein